MTRNELHGFLKLLQVLAMVRDAWRAGKQFGKTVRRAYIDTREGVRTVRSNIRQHGTLFGRADLRFPLDTPRALDRSLVHVNLMSLGKPFSWLSRKLHISR